MVLSVHFIFVKEEPRISRATSSITSISNKTSILTEFLVGKGNGGGDDELFGRPDGMTNFKREAVALLMEATLARETHSYLREYKFLRWMLKCREYDVQRALGIRRGYRSEEK